VNQAADAAHMVAIDAQKVAEVKMSGGSFMASDSTSQFFTCFRHDVRGLS